MEVDIKQHPHEGFGNRFTSGFSAEDPSSTTSCFAIGSRISNFFTRGARSLASLRFGFFLFLLLPGGLAVAEQRFPPPEFESGHQLPLTTTPPARIVFFQYLDVGLLAASLGLASWLVHKKRSRSGLVALSFLSLAYFGFWRRGCICAIGSLQNISLALFDTSYAVPWMVSAFFLLPLGFALFGGRSFCAAVCPHGALQDLVLLKPVKMPSWLDEALSVLPFFYLGLGVLLAATGSAFIICEYDPFVPVFRLSGRASMVLAGVALLLLGVFVGRPYCRFLCPYGALLKIGASVAKWRVRVTPNYCTQCRLCESSCPFGAMREPQSPPTDPKSLNTDRRRLALFLALLPLLLIGGGSLGGKFGPTVSRIHPTVSLAQRLYVSQQLPATTSALSPDDLALQRARQDPAAIYMEAAVVQRHFVLGGRLFGVWVALVLGVKLISLSLRRRRTDYEPDRGACLSCARCFEYCPNELIRRGVAPAVNLENVSGCANS